MTVAPLLTHGDQGGYNPRVDGTSLEPADLVIHSAMKRLGRTLAG